MGWRGRRAGEGPTFLGMVMGGHRGGPPEESSGSGTLKRGGGSWAGLGAQEEAPGAGQASSLWLGRSAGQGSSACTCRNTILLPGPPSHAWHPASQQTRPVGPQIHLKCRPLKPHRHLCSHPLLPELPCRAPGSSILNPLAPSQALADDREVFAG